MQDEKSYKRLENKILENKMPIMIIAVEEDLRTHKTYVHYL
jgi:hypothetical protein